MKKISILSLAFITACGFSACSDDNSTLVPAVDVNEPTSDLTFSVNKEAYSSNSLEKTYYDGTTLKWKGDEGFSVFPVGSKILNEHDLFYIADGTNTGTSCQIKGNATIKDTYYCVYPYSESNSIAATTLTVNFPSEQTISAGQFDPKADIMTASTSFRDASFSFKHVCAKLAITVSSEVTSIEVSSAEPLAGNGVQLTLSSDGTPTVGDITSKFNSVNATVSGAGTYYFCVLPSSTSGTITITTNGTKYYQTNLAPARNTIYTMDLTTATSHDVSSK